MKKFVSGMLAFLLFTTLSVSAYAETIPADSASEPTTVPIVQPRAEETTWYFRNNNGIIEKRLWSNTYGKWLTDWIYVGPAL